jgi:2-oxo-4-hydroxy-4-carboxy-5-ureidoimidazoline decarboxylase
MTLDGINGFDQGTFVAAFGDVFEHSPWVAERAYARSPFASGDDLHDAMCQAMLEATPAEQLALIRAHPQLAGKAAIRGELTAASTREQQGAGLDQCSPEEFAELTALNTAYDEKFGFPFIIAVKGHTRESIIAAMRTRLANDVETEHAEALRQIERIAGFRLAAMIVA